MSNNVLGLPETTILSISPDDILLVRVNSIYNVQQLEELGKNVKNLLPKNKVMIVPNDIEFLVIPAQADLIMAGVKK
jgi:hypothetical protein